MNAPLYEVKVVVQFIWKNYRECFAKTHQLPILPIPFDIWLRRPDWLDKLTAKRWNVIENDTGTFSLELVCKDELMTDSDVGDDETREDMIASGWELW